MSNTRATAARVVAQLIIRNGSLSNLLEDHRNEPDWQLLQEMVYGCCRWFHLLEYLLDQLLSKPLKSKDRDLKALLLVGLYQLREMRVPDHAAINETVAATALLNKPWARGLVNGVLRNYRRQEQALVEKLQQAEEAIQHSHPSWLARSIKASWPQVGATMFATNNLRAPMVLRVNPRKTDRESYLASLAELGIEASAGTLSSSAIYLTNPVAVTDLPGFTEGFVSVQDEASQLVPALLDLGAGQRVLDACSAPGGKAGHILESERSLTELVCIEREQARAMKIEENLNRLQLKATIHQVDANALDTWWDGQAFDRILLDAPCSASGVIRRHPDIKLLRQADHIASLARQQECLLNSLWPCLRAGGLLLYTTCSVLEEENDAIIGKFLAAHSDAKYEGVAADWGVECAYGRQLLPLQQKGPDGFFYSLLRRA